MKFHISILNLINSATKLKIVKFLINHTASMSEREISSVLNVSHMSVNRTMKELADVNLVTNTVIGGTYLWRINRKSYAFGALSKVIKTIDSIQPPIEDLKKVILLSIPEEMILKIILFGSVSKGREEAHSDIDVFFLVKNQKHKDEVEPYIDKLALKCLDRYGNVLFPYILTENEMKQKRNLKLLSEIRSGIQIYPHVP